jgi:hypothetical protein
LIQVESKQKTDEQKQGYQKLKELEALGLGMVTIELLKHRQLIVANYEIAFK